MSVSVMSLVFKHYPGQGGEYTLALCLADFANDEGESIWPAVTTMAHNSRQSVRTVQRQLRAMEDSGWLICVERSSGGKGRPSRYRINPAWLDSPKSWTPNPVTMTGLGPVKPCHGDGVSDAQTPSSTTSNHDTAVSPEPSKNHHKNPVRPISERQTESAEPSDGLEGSPDRQLADWMFGLVLALHPKHKPPNWRRWCREIRLMRVRDARTPEQIAVLFRWANGHAFWSANILSPGKLREKWDKLVIQRKQENGELRPGRAVAGDDACIRCTDGTVGRRKVPGIGWLCNAHLEELEVAHG